MFAEAALSTIILAGLVSGITVLITRIHAARAGREDLLYEIFIPSEGSLIEEKLRFAGVGRGDVVFDLGAGDGRAVIAAARCFGASAVGVEVRRPLVRDARRRARLAGVATLTRFIRRDFMKVSLARADVLVLYLTSSSLGALEPKLERELRPGARVVTHEIPFPGWVPARSEAWSGEGGQSAVFYLYRR